MPRNTRYYSQRANSLIIADADGTFSRFITDFFDDNSISVEQIGERVEISQGLDKAALSFASYDGGQITVQLKPTSPEVGFLNKLVNRQRTSPLLLNLTLTDGVTEITRLFNAGLQKPSRDTGGPTMQAVTFVFKGTRLEEDESEGVSI